MRSGGEVGLAAATCQEEVEEVIPSCRRCGRRYFVVGSRNFGAGMPIFFSFFRRGLTPLFLDGIGYQEKRGDCRMLNNGW